VPVFASYREIDLPPVEPEEARRRLRDHGIHVPLQKLDGVIIAREHRALKKILAGSQWAESWATTLRRAPGAERRSARLDPSRPFPVTGIFIPMNQLFQ
jgi:hypothetical protein